MLLQIKYVIILLNVLYCAEATLLNDRILPNGEIPNKINNGEVVECIVNIVKTNNLYKPTLLFHDPTQYKFIDTEIMDIVTRNYIPIVSKTNIAYINETNDFSDGTLIILQYIESCDYLVNVTNVNMKLYTKYIIIVNENITRYCIDFKKAVQNVAAYDATFFYKDEKRKTFKMVTAIPNIDPKTCKSKNNTKITQVGTCRGGFKNNRTLTIFPNKQIQNWMKCPLNVGMGTLYPYVKSYNNSNQNLDPLKDIEGSDVEIMKIVADYFNASLKLYHIKIVAENVLMDLSFMPFLLNGAIEVCAGGLYRTFGDIVSYSGVYSRQTVIWVYTVERENASWLTFMKKTDGSYIFLIFYLIYSSVFTLFCYFDGKVIPFATTLIYSWGALFGAASLKNPRTFKQKILNLFYLVLCSHMSAYVSVQLYTFFTIQGPPYVFKDTDDLFRSDRRLYMKDKAKYFIEDEKYVSFANTSFNCKDFHDCLAKTLVNRGITLIVDGLFPDVQSSTAVDDEARILKATEPVVFVYHEMLIRKESLLIGSFERILRRLFEAGICEKLYEESIGILVIDKARRANQNMMSNSYNCEIGCTMTLSQYAGVFYFWILGCILSCLTFCGEILFNKRRMVLTNIPISRGRKEI